MVNTPNPKQDAVSNSIVVTCASGLETLLIKEMHALELTNVEPHSGAVRFIGTLEDAYRICLHSRIASRVLWVVSEQVCTDDGEIYDLTKMVPWERYFAPEKKVRVLVDIVGVDNVNSQYVTFQVMDAVRDVFQENCQSRVITVKEQADVYVHAFWANDEIQFSIDLAGKPLHQRGYRQEQGAAPLKESLAAALLYWSGFNEAPDSALLDPFCGSGTILIEAALMQRKISPGLLRNEFGLEQCLFFDKAMWLSLKERAQAAVLPEPDKPSIRGFDVDAQAIVAAQANIRAAQVERCIHIQRAELGTVSLPKSVKEVSKGFVVTNAPYGERVGEESQIAYLYTALGNILQPLLPNWTVGVLSNHVESIDRVGLAQAEVHRFNNGPIRCYFKSAPWHKKPQPALMAPLIVTDYEPLPEQRDFINRLRKNVKPLRKWAEKSGVSCYRIYDADMPEFNMAIDWYDGQFHVQEYKPPKTVDEEKAANRLAIALQSLVKLFDVPRSAIALKSRAKQKGKQQYNRLQKANEFRVVSEAGVRLRINMRDYLDTGLFLDHRPVRGWLQERSQGKRVLNLFSYTCAGSVHAAVGGAKTTTSVDMSRTYLDWGRANLYLNGFSENNHRLVHANCMQWLRQHHLQYDVIFLDPPTFSNSKRMHGIFDVQRDHVELIDLAMKRLEKGGQLLFSNNYRRFALAPELYDRYQVKDVTRESIPMDFKGSKSIHCCFEIMHLVE